MNASGVRSYAQGEARETFMQMLLSSAGIAAKTGLGDLIHKVVKFRPAQNVETGSDRNPEALWVSSVKYPSATQLTQAMTGIAASTAALRIRRSNVAGKDRKR